MAGEVRGLQDEDLCPPWPLPPCDDIKTVRLAPPSPGPKTVPLPDIGVGHAPRQHSPGPPASASASPFVAPLSLSVRSQLHSQSLASSSSASIGKSDMHRLANSEFNKYAEDDDEDYDDVFGKPNGSCVRFFSLHTAR